MTPAQIFVLAICSIAIVVLVAGGILTITGFRDAPEEPTEDGTTDNGTKSRKD